MPFVVPRWARAQRGPFTGQSAQTLRDVADAVLPESLGAHRLDTAVEEFTQWLRSYKAGAEMSAGYGFTRIQVVPLDPSSHYVEQLEQLDKDARGKRGVPFAKLDLAGKREIVQAALASANVDALPRRPNGQHVAADLLGFFCFISSDGHDFLYNAAIKRDDCRGLASSGQRPAPLR
ncbi:MAG TPA: gluconate 2-dehydrogenase subunit 3 family protein [Vicinamibacterales bacterium]|nr:gluconate 2-dehydrogenase subunit 3 family protein [Vicinamibacterales bacterium]